MEIVVGYKEGEIPDEIALCYTNRVYDVGPQVALQELMSSGFFVSTKQLDTCVILHTIVKERN